VRKPPLRIPLSLLFGSEIEFRASPSEPHADPLAPHESPSAQRVRALGGRPDALPPSARHSLDAAGTQSRLTVDSGFSSRLFTS
jgi:hypothetical protein